MKKALLSLINPITRGDPQSPLRWISKSLRHIAKALQTMGHRISTFVLSRILREEGYSLQVNRKVKEGGNHPDRDEQFQYIAKTVKNFEERKQPAISIDAKKKELIGEFKNNGQEWGLKGNPRRVNVYDFPSNSLGRATPYGLYDLTLNQGFVNLGVSYDTSKFAVESIRRWWYSIGTFQYPEASELLLTADGGGSNGSRRRMWKTELQKFANEVHLSITVCHYPPGTSKWNPIEHRLFAPISMNWRAEPLTSFEKMQSLIQNTTTSKGLTVLCVIDETEYQKGIKISEEEMARIHLEKHSFHGEWNYSLCPI